MAEAKKQDTPELNKYYFPEANDGKGGTVLAKDRAEADAKVKAGDFVNPNVAPESAGEDKAE